MQPANKSEGDNFLTAAGDSSELVLEDIDVGLETISLPSPDGEKVVATLLGFLAGGVLGEEHFSHLSEFMEGVG